MSVVKKDLEQITSAAIDFENFRDKTFLISGASGFLPSYMVETLIFLNKAKKLNIQIIGLVRNLEKANLRFTHYQNESCLKLIKSDVSENIFPSFEKVDYIIHAASQASPVFYKTDPVGTLKANSLGTINLLELAKKYQIKDFLFFSTGEVYGQLPEELIPVKESTLGAVDQMNVRSCYAESKRFGENACISYGQQYGLSVKIVRPFHTYGPGMLLSDGRVFSDFVANIVNNQNIVLKSDGRAVRPYCYIADATVAFFTIILKGKSLEAYNMGNPDAEVSVLELAQELVEIYPEKKLKIEFLARDKNDPYVPSSINRNCPDISKLVELGWKPRHTIKEGFRKTIESYLSNSDIQV